MKIDFIADTNFLIYVQEGHAIVEPFLIYDFGISFVTEVELLGFKGITYTQQQQLTQLIDDCFGIGWNHHIREQTINLRQQYAIKLPDAIIAATAVAYDIPLITADQGFEKIKELDLILIKVG